MPRRQAPFFDIDANASIAVRNYGMFAALRVGHDDQPARKPVMVETIGMARLDGLRCNPQRTWVNIRAPDQTSIGGGPRRVFGENANSMSRARARSLGRGSPCSPMYTRRHSRDRAAATPTSCRRDRYRAAACRVRGRASRVEAPGVTIRRPCKMRDE